MPEGLPASRFPVLNFPNMAHLTANDKDFSLALEMTIWESDVSLSLSHKSLEISNPQSLIPAFKLRGSP